MTITRAEAERLDFSGVSDGERLPPVTPGEVLRAEFMAPLWVEPLALAAGLDMLVERADAILDGTQAIEAEDAARLAAWFQTSARFWTGLQASHDAGVAAREGEEP